MPVSFVAEWHSQTGSTTTFDGYYPGGQQLGDLAFVFLVLHKQSSGDVVITPPGDWTLLYDSLIIPSYNYGRVLSYYKIITDVDDDPWTWTVNVAIYALMTVAVYRGVDQGKPIPVKSEVLDSNNDAYTTAAGITMPSRGMIVAHFGARDANPCTVTPPDGMTERVDQATNYSTDITQEVCDQAVEIGATGDKTCTWSAAVDYAAAHLFGLQEASPGYHMII